MLLLISNRISQIFTPRNDAKDEHNKVATIDSLVSERSKRIDKTLDRLQITKDNKLRTDLDYTFPKDYRASNSLFQRINEAIRMRVTMIHELKVRDELNDEANLLFFGTLTLLSLFYMATLSLDPTTSISNTTIFVFVTFAIVFSAGYSFIFAVFLFMNLLLPSEKALGKQDVLRVLAYVYPIFILSSFFSFLRVSTGLNFSLVVLIITIFAFGAMVVTVRHMYNTNMAYSIFGIIVPYTVALLVIAPIVGFLVGASLDLIL